MCCCTVLVTPSTDKAWIKAPWACSLIAIPDGLLTSVARPRSESKTLSTPALQPGVPLTGETTLSAEASDPSADAFDPERLEEVLLEFEGGEPRMHVSGARLTLLRSFDYCRSLLSGRWAVKGSKEVPTLSMPCKRAVLEEIFTLLETGELTHKRAPTPTLLGAIEATADMLGCSARKLNPLLERTTFESDLWTISPLWWVLHRNEQALMLGTSASASDASLVAIDATLAQVTGYHPIPKDDEDAWLFPKLPHMLGEDSFKNFKVFVDTPGETTLMQLPPAVIEILSQHASCVAIAGGAVLGGVTNFINHGCAIVRLNSSQPHGVSRLMLRAPRAPHARAPPCPHLTRSPRG